MVARQALVDAVAAHERRQREPWTGPCHFDAENDAIDAARRLCFRALGCERGTLISNDNLLKLLEKK